MPSTRQSVTILLFTMLIVALAACAGPTQPPAPTFTLFPSVPPPAQATQTTPLPTIEQPTPIPPTEGPPPASFAITPENANAIQVQVAGDTGGQAINVLRVAPDGTIGVATAGGALLYDPTTLQQVGALAEGEGLIDLLFSPDGRYAVTFPEPVSGPVRFWDMATRAEIEALRGLLPDGSTAVAASPDGMTLATGDLDGMVTLWDTSAGAQVGQLNVWQMAADFDPMLAGEFGDFAAALADRPGAAAVENRAVAGERA